MQKEFDDTNWKQEILGSLEFNQSKFASKLLKDGAKSYMIDIDLERGKGSHKLYVICKE